MALWLVGLVTGVLVDAAVCSVISLLVFIFHCINKYCVTNFCGTWSLSYLNFVRLSGASYYGTEYVCVCVSACVHS